MDRFYDLNICPRPGTEANFIELCANLGYKVIAFNHVIDMSKGLFQTYVSLITVSKWCDKDVG